MNIVPLNAGPKPPSDLARQLRDIADAVERGEVVDLVAAYMQTGAYEFLYGTSLSTGLELATLLQHRCIERFKV